ncbi:MAG: type II toxin-antitoxin system HicB family antitoxin [candidate division Zixibacteria bacterium]|nr:type II toxin-antitoxin system HicB family antitoxin [candidate division Zixibacteria bacterium]
MKFVTTIEQDEEGGFVVECSSVPGCISQGKTEQQGLENIEV